jgi:phage tail-like protein
MDANGTRFSLVLGTTDWEFCCAETSDGQLAKAGVFGRETNLYLEPQRCEMTLFPQLFLFPPVPNGLPLELGQRRGAARDRFGNWYWISLDNSAVLVWTEGATAAAEFWRPGLGSACAQSSSCFHPVTAPSPVVLTLSGLAVTEDHYLVVGVSGPPGQAGYLAFDLAGGGAPQHFLWPASVAFAPFDMAPRAGGGVWILDRENHRYWEIDRHFHIRRRQSDAPASSPILSTFVPSTPLAPRPACDRLPVTPITTVDATDLPTNVCAIEALSADSVILLHLPAPGARFSSVSVYRQGQPCGAPVSLDSLLEHLPPAQQSTFSLVAHDFAFVPGTSADPGSQLGRLSIASNAGTQSFAFDLSLAGGQIALQPVMNYFPMRSFGGKALVAAAGKVSYDFQNFWLPIVEQTRPNYPLSATFQTRVFDGGQPQCVWHRLLVDGCLPHDTQIQVWSRAADERTASGDMPPWLPWSTEPPLLRRPDGPELPFLPVPSNPDRGTFELLFQKSQGRYLQLRLQLFSNNGRVTPRLRALRVYYPRFSYLKEYLPAAYRGDADSASFLDRFLANFEGFYTAIEDRIAAAQVLFDFRSAPADTLPWLASWFGVATDPAWTEPKQRAFIEHAMEFFQYRGTTTGLRMALRLALEDQPTSHFLTGDPADRACADRIRIVEKFRTRSTPSVLLGDPTEAIGPRPVGTASRWWPADGADELHRRYRQYLAENQHVVAAADRFPVIEPDDPSEAGPWWDFLASRDEGVDWNGYLQAGTAGAINLRQAFWQTASELPSGALPATAETDRQRWQDFLCARYPTIAELNAAHGTAWPGFSQVPLAGASASQVRLQEDWTDFTEAWDDYFNLGGAAAKFVGRRGTAWQDFARRVLGFVPSAAGNDLEAWQDFLRGHYPDVETLNSQYASAYTSFAAVTLPLDLPDTGQLKQDWTNFVLQSAQLNAGTRQDLWQSFLTRRYRSVDALNAAYGTNWAAFAQVVVPRTLPTNSSALQDWFQFESVVLVMHQAAHKFVVLLPIVASDFNNLEKRQAQLALAQRIIEMEKPAHTMFEVKFYWALFRVGDARLGLDTLVGLGSRAPELLTPMILNRGFLSESVLAPAPPKDSPGRFLVGTDAA